jgi:hypothetical protein
MTPVFGRLFSHRDYLYPEIIFFVSRKTVRSNFRARLEIFMDVKIPVLWVKTGPISRHNPHHLHLDSVHHIHSISTSNSANIILSYILQRTPPCRWPN